jgi:hypothetical protein
MSKINPISVSIEVSYDYDASSINYQNTFKSSPFQSNYGSSDNLLQYIDYENIKLIDNISDLITIDTSNSRKSLLEYLRWTNAEAKEYKISELRSEILNDVDFRDISDLEKELNITKNYILIETRGYSQGDYAEVIIPIDLLRECWGTNKDIKDEDLVSQQYIDNIFWDAPIWGRIEISASQDYTFELYEVENIPEYPNYKQGIEFINDEILKFITNEFKNVPALQNIIDATKEALPSEIKYPKY